MRVTIWLKIVILSFTLIAGTAQAQLQTWRFIGTVYQQNSGFVPPSFAAIGQMLTVDYVFDTAASIESSTKSVSFDGATSSVDSSNINLGGGILDAINVSPLSPRPDGVTFMSFNYAGAPPATTVSQFLNNYSVASGYAIPADTRINLRLDFSSYSVWASPTSFVRVSPVPEPGEWLLMICGIALVWLVARRRTQNGAMAFA